MKLKRKTRTKNHRAIRFEGSNQDAEFTKDEKEAWFLGWKGQENFNGGKDMNFHREVGR